MAHLGSVLPRCLEFAYAFVSTFCAEAEETRERPHRTRERGAFGVAVRIGLSIECAHPSTFQPIFAGPAFRALHMFERLAQIDSDTTCGRSAAYAASALA
jgi:hypothetical protein